jgi:peptidoglycan/LPS O-acetylase OafA/YrhL
MVPLFYWMSGFVIALTVLSSSKRNKLGLTFLARRLCRITPLWWISILFSICVEVVFDFKHGSHPKIPNWMDIFTNLTFLNFVLGRDSLNFPGYSLCLEVQMYVLTYGILAVGTTIGASGKFSPIPTLILTSAVLCNTISSQVDGLAWLTSSWPWFSLGFLCYLRVKRQVTSDWTLCGANALAMKTIATSFDRGCFTTLTAIFTVVAISEYDLDYPIWKLGKGLQYLGVLSFPLYLLHIKFVAHGITFDKARAYLGLHPNATFFMLVLLPLLLAVAITPLMNRIDSYLMAKLFPRAAARA